MDILVLVLDSIEDQLFRFLVVDLVRMYYFFGVDMTSSTHIDNKKKDISSSKMVQKFANLTQKILKFLWAQYF